MRLNLHKLVCAIFLLTLSGTLSAQDPHFSQFFNAPLHLNPAMSGVFDGQFRVAANYRNQWSSILGADAFKTMHASVDMRTRVFSGDYFTTGLNVLQDQAGAGTFKRTNAQLTAGYLKQVAGGRYRRDKQYLSAGLQAGLGQFSHEWGNYWFSNQYNPITEVVDPSAPSGEFLADNTGLFLDISAGLMYYAVFDKDASVYAGGAVFHANQPNISFLDDGSEKLYQKMIFHAGGQVPFNPNFSILPAAYIAFQGPSSQMVFGNNFRFTNNDKYEVAIRAGVWTRLSNRLDSGKVLDALIYSFTLEMERWQLGLSYDVNHSSLRTASNGRGGFEVSLIYVHPTQTRYFVDCPQF